MPLNFGDVRRLVEQVESETLEFKHSVPRPTEIAKLIGAFSNASGGVIFFGIRDDKPWPDRVIGINEGEFRQNFDRAILLIRPAPQVDIAVIELEGKKIGVVEVIAPAGGLTTIQGQVWTRSGDRTVPATAQQIMHWVDQNSSVSTPDTSEKVAQLVECVVSQGEIIQALRGEKKSSIRARSVLVAVMTGVVLGCLLMLAFG